MQPNKCLPSKHEIQLYLNSSKSYPINITGTTERPRSLRMKIDSSIDKAKDSISSEVQVFIKDLRKHPFQPRCQDELGTELSSTDIFIYTLQIEDIPCLSAALQTLQLILANNVVIKNLTVSLYTDQSTNVFAEGVCHGNLLTSSNGCIQIPLVDFSHKRHVGYISVDYLVIKPRPLAQCSLPSQTNLFEKSLNIGHRGSGATFSDCTKSVAVTENTVKSFCHAAQHGADFVEFDVLLTKDLVPVVYHDFEIGVKVHTLEGSSSILKVPVCKMTCKDLQEVVTIGESSAEDSKMRHERSAKDATEKLCPTLQEVFQNSPPDLGFVIEVKYPQLLVDHTSECEDSIDQNIYVDRILDVVDQYRGKRKVMFCCFEPHITTLLKRKQSTYPVLFLTSGVNSNYTPCLDLRTRDIPSGVAHARSEGLEGLSIFMNPIEDKIKDTLQLLQENGLRMFTWGTRNNDYNLFKFQRGIGVDGVIHDSVEEFHKK